MMRKFFNKGIFFLIGCSALFLFCTQKTDGFALSKVLSELSPHPEWETDEFLERSALNQPYYYLGHGAQTYAFVSNDGKYVLKFYRHHRTKHPLHPLAFALSSPLKNRLFQTLAKREKKRLKDFKSYLLAYHHFRQESGLIFLHLNKTSHLKTKLTFFDKIGVKHEVESDKIEFLLQKKATLIYPALEEWIAKGQLDKAKEGLSHLVILLNTRLERGLFDKDPDLQSNFGFIETTPIQIDVGRFTLQPSQNPAEELIRITDRLCSWLDQRAPSLAEHLRQEVAKCA